MIKPAYKVTIIFTTQDKCPDEEKSRSVAKEALLYEGVRNPVEVNLVFTDNRQIAKLNKQFLGHDGPTDVIAFSSKKGRPVKSTIKGLIGEVVISVDCAVENAGRFNTTPQEEIYLYIIHGILHLLGYDDKRNNDRNIMRDRQDRILRKVCAQEKS